MKRKGQGGAAASTLILIILLLIIFYILFLPQEVREELLGEGSGTGTSGGGSGKLSSGTLLDKRNIDMFPEKMFRDKSLPDITLKEIVNAKELAGLGTVYVKNSWFEKDFANISFKVADFDKAENIMLSMRAAEAEGRLTIRLNGIVVFDEEVEKGDIGPIMIDNELLYEDNDIEFVVNGVGAMFWTANTCTLRNIRVIGDITDESRQKSSNIFLLTEEEYDNIESVNLDFLVMCGEGERGILSIELNTNNISSEVPECSEVYSKHVPKETLRAGDNTVIFKTTEGGYSIEDIRLTIDYKEHDKWRWGFHISSNEWDDIDDGDKDVVMKIDFDDYEDNRADFEVNNHDDDFDEDDDHIEMDITGYVEEGYNTLEITPKSTFTIERLRIELED